MLYRPLAIDSDDSARDAKTKVLIVDEPRGVSYTRRSTRGYETMKLPPAKML